MHTNRVTAAPICARCGARADARRGPTAACLSCGQAFPLEGGAPPRAPTAMSPLVWVGAALLALCVVGALAGVAFVALRSEPSAPAPRATSSSTLAPGPVLADVVDASPSASTKPPPQPLSDAERDELAGNYTCAMDDTPAFPCRVANGTLEKLAGSQRFKGPIQKLPNGGLAFSGTFFCPFGGCTHPVSATFVRQGPGRYIGRFPVNGPEARAAGGGPGGERVVLIKVR
ncbi:MAG: hypothetical protein IPG50_26580 [Myxococcales bacterium]|nr:hypothetical protein [Myxococcales bacterium]